MSAFIHCEDAIHSSYVNFKWFVRQLIVMLTFEYNHHHQYHRHLIHTATCVVISIYLNSFTVKWLLFIIMQQQSSICPLKAHLIVYDNIISFKFHYRLFSLQRFVTINHWWGYICHCTNSMNRYYYYFRLMFDKNKNKPRVEILLISSFLFFILIATFVLYYLCSRS